MVSVFFFFSFSLFFLLSYWYFSSELLSTFLAYTHTHTHTLFTLFPTLLSNRFFSSSYSRAACTHTHTLETRHNINQSALGVASLSFCLPCLMARILIVCIEHCYEPGSTRMICWSVSWMEERGCGESGCHAQLERLLQMYGNGHCIGRINCKVIIFNGHGRFNMGFCSSNSQ